MRADEPMAILDRLLPAWRHSDADVRVTAVRELGDDAQETFATLARRDPEPRVRREALRRLADPDLLQDIAAAESNDELRAFAATRAGEQRVQQAISAAPVEQCLAALQRLTRPSQRATVAARATHADVRRAALAQIDDATAFAEVARRTSDPDIGLEATAHIDDASALRRIATGTTVHVVAQAALDRIHDPEVLRALVQDHHTPKSVRKHARGLLDRTLDDSHPIRVAERHAQRQALLVEVEALASSTEADRAAVTLRSLRDRWAEIDRHGAADLGEEERFQRGCTAAQARIEWAARRSASEARTEQVHQRERSAREQLCDEVEALAGAETTAKLDAARAAWRALGAVHDPHDYDVAARFTAAVERCEERHRRWQQRTSFHERLAALADEAEALLRRGDAARAAQARAALEKRWQRVMDSPEGAKWGAEERDLERRFSAAGEALVQQAQAREAKHVREVDAARTQVSRLCERLESLAASESMKPGAATHALDAVPEALRLLRALPGDERKSLRQRLETGRDELARRAAAQATADEWRLWANADAQRRLIERVEELLAGEDLRALVAASGKIDQEWQQVASAPRHEARQLWERFRTARQELRRQVNAHLAENLEKKRALCEEAERLAEANDLNATAEEFRRLQAEWKAIGPVPMRASQPLFERFRAPAEAFFRRRDEVLNERREKFQQRLDRMRELVAEAESWADSTEWETAASELRRLQSEWRNTAPRASRTPLPEVAAFQAACDRFFERFRQRHDVEAAARQAEVEAIVTGVEALRAELEGAERPALEDVATRLREGLAAWGRRGAVGAALEAALEARLQAACDAIEAGVGDELAAAGIDPSVNLPQREKLCARLEKLAGDIEALAEQPEVEDLGERLRLAMAANTIGGSAAPPRERALQELHEAAARLREKWDRMVPVVGRAARASLSRFEAAWGRVDASRPPSRAH